MSPKIPFDMALQAKEIAGSMGSTRRHQVLGVLMGIPGSAKPSSIHRQPRKLEEGSLILRREGLKHPKSR